MSVSTLELIRINCYGLYTDADRSVFISQAEELVSSSFYGVFYNQAVYLMAAHIYTLLHRPGGSIGATGAINNMREGDLSIGMGSINISRASVTDAWLLMTTYGTQLQALKRAVLPGVSVTGVCNAAQFEV